MSWPEWADAKATGELRENIRSGNVSHAYLLAGPNGVGKADIARAFAQALCCPNVAADDVSLPCGICRSCRNVERGSHPDVETFSLRSQAMLADKPSRASTLTIETVRQMRASAALMPLEGRRRIILLEDAETMLEPAQQALLKTLEEPPQAVTLVLLADEAEALLGTVRSRCREIRVLPAQAATIAAALHARGIAAEMANELVALSRGAAGWALAAATNPTLMAARRDERNTAASWIASPRYERLVTAYKLGEQHNARRAEVVGIVQSAAQLLRDEMILAAGGQAPAGAEPLLAPGNRAREDRRGRCRGPAMLGRPGCQRAAEIGARNDGDGMAGFGVAPELTAHGLPIMSLEQARAQARERFKTRLQAGEKVGGCGCDVEDEVRGLDESSPAECVVGVRFRDSGRVYYFRPGDIELETGDWVIVPTARGAEPARVVIAPHQVRAALLQGDVGAVVRRLDEEDVATMAAYQRGSGTAIRAFGELARARRLGAKPIAADYSFDGSLLTVSYSVPDRERAPDAAQLRDIARDLASDLGCRVELRQVGPRDEARLLGGLGRCGRTLCCSSWLPVFPEISMSMAKNQDLPLNPAKVSGVCGRLLCCLSYENEQYRQMKAVMPKLGQSIDTPGGPGQVVSLHLLKELVTVRLEAENVDATFRCDELDLSPTRVAAPAPLPEPSAALENHEEPSEAAADTVDDSAAAQSRRRRRRRGGRRAGPTGAS